MNFFMTLSPSCAAFSMLATSVKLVLSLLVKNGSGSLRKKSLSTPVNACTEILEIISLISCSLFV